MVTVDVGGERAVLLPQRALLLPAHATLLVADAHIGKAVSFRRLGVPVPRGTTSATLDELSRLVERHSVRRIVFLGDFLHSARAHAASTLGALARWRQRHADLTLTLVRGNHDAHAGDPPAALRFEVVNEPFNLPHVPGLALCHHPRGVEGLEVLAGHVHPCVHLGRGIDRLRLPCFHFAAGVVVLPAFGAFTGMHAVRPAEGDRIYAVADDCIMPIAVAAP